ncbi:MAG: hypothetical protein GY862_32900 [Gammaproteobacteria bacterium]|nr:hypothetical protein [Gammaproteobacteria bacterium]
MKNKGRILLLAVGIGLSGAAWTTPADKDADPAPGDLAGEVMDVFYPPAITEIFDNAKMNKLTGGWDKKIRVEGQDYAAMSVPRRALEVGKTLANIAFLVLNSPDPDAPPSKPLVQEAYNAISAINPPASVKAELQKMRDQYEAGKLKRKALRKEIDRIINEVVPGISQAEDPETRDSGKLVMAAGYFRALYLGAETMAASANPTSEQLNMILGWKDISAHMLNYFARQSTPAFRSSVKVKNLLRALFKITPLVSKPRGQIDKSDAAAITAALKPLFS